MIDDDNQMKWIIPTVLKHFNYSELTVGFLIATWSGWLILRMILPAPPPPIKKNLRSIIDWKEHLNIAFVFYH